MNLTFVHDSEELDLSKNQISGMVPSPLWKLPLLQRLDLSGNELLSGSLPTDFTPLSSLGKFSIN
jgi:Leucine-rich repeat (LRR) protein